VPPSALLDVLSSALAEVGWAGACLYNEATGRLVGGHASRKVWLDKGAEKIPVLIGSWTEEQERRILAMLEPLSAMAGANASALGALLQDVSTDNPALASMFARLAESVAAVPRVDATLPEEFPESDEGLPIEYCCPKCNYAWSGKPN